MISFIPVEKLAPGAQVVERDGAILTVREVTRDGKAFVLAFERYGSGPAPTQRIRPGKMVRVLAPDALVSLDGGICSLTPITAEAREWIAANVAAESWQWQGETLAIDQRSALAIVDGMREEGLRVQS